MVGAGIDIGSRTIKAVVLDGGTIVHAMVVDASARPQEKALQVLSDLPPCPVTATGYGRDLLDVARHVPTITEIKAHSLGVRHQVGAVTTIIDIGGQDLKVICLDREGRVGRFEMNDRCAAGTGKFLEIMSQQLGFSLDDFGAAALAGSGGVTINAMCTVFAESEVVGLLNRSTPREDVARALHHSVVRKVVAMARRLDADLTCVVLSGGGALNPALRHMLADALGAGVAVPGNPQVAGALGCALAACAPV